MKKQLNFFWRRIFVVCTPFIFFLLFSNYLFADGSRDLYPSGATGIRAHLRSTTATTENWPFANNGIHYVYAKAGERITLASSAQNSGNARIRLYSPANVSLVNNQTNGVISNRTAELAGPQLNGGTVANRYTPIYYLVPTGGDGIYRVEFEARGTITNNTTVNANSNWTQATNSSIMAWDVSVINTANTAFIPGRVYVNVLNLNNGTTSPQSNGFYGNFYAQTKDGYTYRVKNNGNNGMYFTFFVNNNGFIDANGAPIYKSLASSTPANLAGKVHDPNSADTAKQFTHKLFYTLPDKNMPATSTGAVPGGSTWLNSPIIVPTVTGVNVVGVETTPSQIGNLKGGYINFTADVQGNYEIKIASPGFPTRILTGPSVAGSNSVYWDGKDGNGVPVPPGALTLGMDVTVRLQGAEVHFPFMDMEYNINGFLLELLDPNDLSQVISDVVYWNDTDVPNTTNGSNPNPKNNSHLSPTNSLGISSAVNGHKWGIGGSGTSGTFGDVRAIDTWTFIRAEETTITTGAIIKNADLAVTSAVPDKTNAVLGEQVAYTIKVKNNGPSDVPGAKFTFTIPAGLNPSNVTFSGAGCGTESTAISYNAATRTYSSNLDLPNGCEITYVITVTVTSSATVGNQSIAAAILRVNDISDPDATNPDINVMPTNAFDECANNGLGGTCNNIKTNNELVVTLPCYNPVTNTAAGIATKQGITLLKRAGTDNGNWPMNRNSGHTVLESNTKGLVITRMTPAQIAAISNPVEGMMVYDSSAQCLKIYSDGAWNCYLTPTCP